MDKVKSDEKLKKIVYLFKNNKIMTDNKYIVYVHIAPNNKRYVGITKMEPEKRWANGNGYRNNKHFINAIHKYGWNKMKHFYWYVDTEEEMYRQEIELIDKFQSYDPDYGYNSSLGGDKGNWKGKNSGTKAYIKEHTDKYRKSHKEEKKEYYRQYRIKKKEEQLNNIQLQL